MNSIGFAFQLDDGGAVHDAIQQRHRQGRVAEVVGPGLEVDVRHQSRADALAARVDDLVPQAGGLRTDAAFNAIEAEFVNDEQVEFGIEADAVVDGAVRQGGRQVFQEFAAGDVMHFEAHRASGLADALDQMTFPHAALADEDEVLMAAQEVAGSERLDLDTADGGVEVPIELGERLKIAEAGALDTALEAAFAAQAGLVGEQAMEEVEVSQTSVLTLLEGGVELLGSHGDAQGRKVGENFVTSARRRL